MAPYRKIPELHVLLVEDNPAGGRESHIHLTMGKLNLSGPTRGEADPDASRLFEAVLRTIREPLVILDADGRVGAVSPALLRSSRSAEDHRLTVVLLPSE